MLAIRNLDGLVEAEESAKGPKEKIETKEKTEESPSQRSRELTTIKLSCFTARLAEILQHPESHQEHILYDSDSDETAGKPPLPTLSTGRPSGLRKSRSFYVDSGSSPKVYDEDGATSPREVRRHSLPKSLP